MSEITAIFWDVGGVLLTNGWDHVSRAKAAGIFGLDREDFEARHMALEENFDKGLVPLDQYLDSVIFTIPRPFSRGDFTAFMHAQSQPHPETIAIAAELARRNSHFLATLNNEPLELNQVRIAKFGLRQYFSAFFSSCFLGLTKPHPEIYRRALQITQRSPQECLFIDDRPANVESAARLEMRALLHNGDASELRLRLNAELRNQRRS